MSTPTPDDFRKWWRETGSASPGPSPEMLLNANAWAEHWAARCLQAQPEPAALTDEYLLGLACKANLVYSMSDGSGFGTCYTEETDIHVEVLDYARAAIAADRATLAQPEPVGVTDDEIDEETATLIPWFFEKAMQAADSDQPCAAGRLTLAAQLLGERRPTIQPVPGARKPVVDYSRVPEIATEAQIRSAAQYLVKKRNCAGDLIPAIEYAIARWGTPTNNTRGTH